MQPPLPLSLTALIGEAQWETVTEGESGAEVWRILGAEIRYLKIAARDAQFSIAQERDKLLWLSGRIAVPQVLHYEAADKQEFLLMSGLDGLHPMHDDLNWTGAERIEFLAKALRQFHALPIEECPYRLSFVEQVAKARENIEKGYVRLDLLEPEHQNRDLWELFAELEALQPQQEDWVLTHGDAYPMNIRAHPQSHDLLGFIDVGGLAVADRYSDFAPIANGITWHLGEESIADFFAAYGIVPDWDKLRFYQLLDEFY